MNDTYQIVIGGIFKSIQGEGINAGRSTAFIRLAFCNMEPRCYFCDEQFDQFETMHLNDIHKAMAELEPFDMVVLTGGEPTCQNIQILFDFLKTRYTYVCIETNGLLDISTKFDWITCSPKTEKIGLHHADEVKFIVDRNEKEMLQYIDNISGQMYANYFLLQPKNNDKEMIDICLRLISNDPKLRLSLQQHKLIRVR